MVVASGSVLTSFVLGVGEEVDASEPVAMSLVTSVVISVVTSGFLVGFKVVMSALVIALVLVEGGEEVVNSESVTMSVIQ